MKHPLIALIAAAALGLGGRSAVAQQDDWDGDFRAAPAERRSDVTFGAALGGLVGRATAFPNEVGKIGDPAYEADTGGAFGLGYKLWLGAALSDFLSFGLGYGRWQLSADGPEAVGQGFLFRVETFPLFYEGGVWRDLGFHADFGIGTTKLEQDSTEVADGGAASLVTAGIFLDAWQLGKLNAGPVAEYTHAFSSTLSSHSGLLGLRVAFYGGPSAPAGPPAPRRPVTARWTPP